jgi:hypothetical protein
MALSKEGNISLKAIYEKKKTCQNAFKNMGCNELDTGEGFNWQSK